METRRSLSDFWRRDRSGDHVRELVSVLQGADILIGNMGSDIQVTWSGAEVSYTDFRKHIVALDYGPLRGQECPFPGNAVDEVIGYAAHEGGHCLWSAPENRETIRYQLQARRSALPKALQEDWQRDALATLVELGRIQNILEDAHIDHQVAHRWPVLGEYIRLARTKIYERITIDFETIAQATCTSRNAVINLWASVSLYGHPLPHPISEPVKRVMDALLDLTRRAIAEREPIIRQRMAVDAAIILWEGFPTLMTPPLSQSHAKDQASPQPPGEKGRQYSQETNKCQGTGTSAPADARNETTRAKETGSRGTRQALQESPKGQPQSLQATVLNGEVLLEAVRAIWTTSARLQAQDNRVGGKQYRCRRSF